MDIAIILGADPLISSNLSADQLHRIKKNLQVTIEWSGGEQLKGPPLFVQVDGLLPEPEPEPIPLVSNVSHSQAVVEEFIEFTITGQNLPDTIAVSLEGTSNCYINTKSSSKVTVGCNPEESGSRKLYIALYANGPPIQGSPWTVQS